MTTPELDRTHITRNVPVVPSLRFLFRLSANLATPVSIGDSGQGLRKVIPVLTGVLEANVGDSLKGQEAFQGAQSVPELGGADYLTLDANSLSRLDARYVFRLKSGHFLFFQSRGKRYVPSGDEEAIRQLNQGMDIDPKKYYFRLKLDLESDDPDPAVQEACCGIVIASAVRGAKSIVYDAYVVL